MAEEHHDLGSMDITEHKRTWNTFMTMATYGTVITFVFVLLLLFIYG